MRSHSKGSLSATTQVKVSSPEILLIAQGQGFHFLETNTGIFERGENISGVPGSKSVAGKRTVYIGTWENRIVPLGSFCEVEETTKKYDDSVVGLIHSRGVCRVMPVESIVIKTLEGVSGLTQRDEVCHAIH